MIGLRAGRREKLGAAQARASAAGVATRSKGNRGGSKPRDPALGGWQAGPGCDWVRRAGSSVAGQPGGWIC